jgi:serine/threonine protein kinase
VSEIGEADGRMFFVMEFVGGETLHACSRRSQLSMRQVIEIANELAQALDAAHRGGIVHRDLKPANVMVAPQGHVKVMDFGLAKQTASTATAGAAVGEARRGLAVPPFPVITIRVGDGPPPPWGHHGPNRVITLQEPAVTAAAHDPRRRWR